MDKYYFISSPHPNHHILNYTLQQVLPFSVKKRKEKKKHLNSFLFLSINHKLYQSHLQSGPQATLFSDRSTPTLSSISTSGSLNRSSAFQFCLWALPKAIFVPANPEPHRNAYLDLSIKCRPFVSLPALPTHVMSGSEIHTVF